VADVVVGTAGNVGAVDLEEREAVAPAAAAAAAAVEIRPIPFDGRWGWRVAHGKQRGARN